ncbi:ensconsin-like [Macrobrachium rosenbergii]|uniref:ensconsin-like n=1 Tax=Macrobrachium rosenbergii TaxID=79674 RepID=UPI0034D57AB9
MLEQQNATPPPAAGMSALSQAHSFMPKWTESEPEKTGHSSEQCQSKKPTPLSPGKPPNTSPEPSTGAAQKDFSQTFCTACKVYGHSPAWAKCPSNHKSNTPTVALAVTDPTSLGPPAEGRIYVAPPRVASLLPGGYDAILGQDFQSPQKSRQSRGPHSPNHFSGASNPPPLLPQSRLVAPGNQEDVQSLPVPPEYDLVIDTCEPITPPPTASSLPQSVADAVASQDSTISYLADELQELRRIMVEPAQKAPASAIAAAGPGGPPCRPPVSGPPPPASYHVEDRTRTWKLQAIHRPPSALEPNLPYGKVVCKVVQKELGVSGAALKDWVQEKLDEVKAEREVERIAREKERKAERREKESERIAREKREEAERIAREKEKEAERITREKEREAERREKEVKRISRGKRGEAERIAREKKRRQEESPEKKKERQRDEKKRQKESLEKNKRRQKNRQRK